MSLHRIFTGFLFFFFLSLAEGSILILQMSDQHSDYLGFVQTLGAIEQTASSFLKDNPEGQVVLIVNGDVTSKPGFWSKEMQFRFLLPKSQQAQAYFKQRESLFSFQNFNGSRLFQKSDKNQYLNKRDGSREWSYNLREEGDWHYSPQVKEERGDLAYKVLSELSKKYQVIYTFGNHDAFDWEDSELFVRQMEMLKDSGAYLLHANIGVSPEYRHLFQSFVDLFLPSGQKIRFVGFTIAKPKKKRLKLSPSVIKRISSVDSKLLEVLDDTERDGSVSSLVLSTHLSYKSLKKLLEKFQNHKAMRKVLLAYAGHDHFLFSNNIGETLLIDSGAYLSYLSVATLDFNTEEEIFNRSHYFLNERQQKEIGRNVNRNSLEYSLMKEVQDLLGEFTKSKRELLNQQKADLKNSHKKDKPPYYFKRKLQNLIPSSKNCRQQFTGSLK